MHFRISEDEGAEFGIPSGLYNLNQLAELLREHQHDHEVVSFIATVMQSPEPH